MRMVIIAMLLGIAQRAAAQRVEPEVAAQRVEPEVAAFGG